MFTNKDAADVPEHGGHMQEAARRSLISVTLTAVMITANHLYVLGPKAFGLGAVLLVGPAALLWWFRNTRSSVAFAGYLFMNLWIVVGFGLIKGLWGITLPLYLGTGLAAVSAAYPKPMLGPYGFEASGILMFIGSLFVAYYAFQLLRAKRGVLVLPRGLARPSALLAAAGLVAAFVLVDRDRWAAPVGGVVKIGTDESTARVAIERALRVDRVDAIVGGISRFGLLTKPLASAARIPQTCVCSVTSIGDGE